MFLSYLKLNRANPHVRRCLGNAYEMHRTILSAFGQVEGENAREELGVTYRLFIENELKVYVLHKASANWELITEKGFVPAKMPNNPKNINSVVDGIVEGRRYVFDILCSPNKKIPREGKLSHRKFISEAEERFVWLERKAEQNGFLLMENSVYESGQEKIMITKKGSGKGTQVGVRFCGELEVTEETLFKKAFEKGIGSGKAFGLGMLMLFPKR